MSEWQPIETARFQDGRDVLVSDGVDIGIGYWVEGNTDAGGNTPRYLVCAEVSGLKYWQPLPDPPEDKK